MHKGNIVGEAQIGVNYDFIARALTDQGHEEETINTNQYFKIKSFELHEESGLLIFDCDVHEYALN